MSKQTSVFNHIEVNKKYFYASKKAIPLNLVNTNNTVISYGFKITTPINISLVIYMMMA